MKRQETLLNLVENSIFDKLLGEMIYSRSHFMEHMDKKELKTLQVFDFKFLKEMNTAMTYADADNNIKMLWSRIKEAIPDNERNKIIVSRFAGTIYVGVRKGSTLSDECQAHLNRIVTLPFGKDADYEVPLGHAFLDLEKEEGNGLASHQILNKLENASEESYDHTLVKDIQRGKGENDQFIAQMMKINIDELKKREYQSLSKIELYALALRGQRKLARIGKLIEYSDKGEFKDDTAYSELRKALVSELG